MDPRFVRLIVRMPVILGKAGIASTPPARAAQASRLLLRAMFCLLSRLRRRSRRAVRPPPVA